MRRIKSRKHKISDASTIEDVSYGLDQHASKRPKTWKPSEDESLPVSPKVINEKPNTSRKKDVSGRRRLELMNANKEEDRIINKLEKVLGIKKRKKKKNSAANILSSFSHDGLDYILEVLDKPGSAIEGDLELNEDMSECSDNKNSEFSRSNNKTSLVRKTGTPQSEINNELHEISSNDSYSSAEESGVSESDNENIICDNDNDVDLQSTKSVKMGEKCKEIPESTVNIKKPDIKKRKPKIWEDIYGRLRDEEGNVLPPNSTSGNVNEVYVPPHERIKQDPISDERKTALEQIKRKLRGLTNRLSISNVSHISNGVEEMYKKNSRNDMNQTLMSILSEVLLSPVAVPPCFAVEQAMLVTILHRSIGSDVGAFFLQSLALKLNEFLHAERNCEPGKQCNNLLTFLCHLYNFKVMHSRLIFNILKLLVNSFQETDIELILLVLKHAGFMLRKDDPVSFKEVLLLVQSKAAALKPGQSQTRVDFMLDVLIELRNNNMEKMKKLLTCDPSIIKHASKVLEGIGCNKSRCSEELSISYEDLLNAHERGRWWIVGSSWSERASETTANETSSSTLVDNSCNEKMLTLARKLQMNTKVRQVIFNIVMTAQDYLDAFETLLRLDLKNQQEKEIISVLLHCSLQEKNFNPYYVYLASKFCKYNRRFSGYLKFALWSKFRELENMTSRQRSCLASFLVHLFTTETLDISVLKVFSFSEMNGTAVHFFKKILTAVLLHECDEICYKVFQRISSNNNLQLLRESLRLFMHHFILCRRSEMDSSVAEKVTLRVKMAENALDSSKRVFKL